MLPPWPAIPERSVTGQCGPPARAELTSQALVSGAPPSPAPGRWRLPPRRLAALLAVWVVAAGGALLLANALDSPVDEGARDEAQAVAPGPVATPGAGPAGAGPAGAGPAAGAAGAGPAASPPPLVLFLDQAPPDGIGDLPPNEQAERLLELAKTDPDPRRLLELGSVLQQLGQPDQARVAFRAVLARSPGNVAAQTGLAMATSGKGAAGLSRAAARLRKLARQYPEDQLVAFNQGVVEVLRRRVAPAARAWSRAVELGPTTLLGAQATDLLDGLRARGVPVP
jgi:hypothetical protein